MNVELQEQNRKLVTFSENSFEMDQIQSELDAGWSVTSLMFYNRRYIGILEKVPPLTQENPFLCIPNRKKIKVQM